MIFVRLAIGSTFTGRLRQSTAPLRTSKSEPRSRRLAQLHLDGVGAGERHVRHRLGGHERIRLALDRPVAHRRRSRGYRHGLAAPGPVVAVQVQVGLEHGSHGERGGRDHQQRHEPAATPAPASAGGEHASRGDRRRSRASHPEARR